MESNHRALGSETHFAALLLKGSLCGYSCHLHATERSFSEPCPTIKLLFYCSENSQSRPDNSQAVLSDTGSASLIILSSLIIGYISTTFTTFNTPFQMACKRYYQISSRRACILPSPFQPSAFDVPIPARLWLQRNKTQKSYIISQNCLHSVVFQTARLQSVRVFAHVALCTQKLCILLFLVFFA